MEDNFPCDECCSEECNPETCELFQDWIDSEAEKCERVKDAQVDKVL